MDFAPDTRANNEKRNANVSAVVEAMPKHPADYLAMKKFCETILKKTAEGNREYIGVEREIDLLHWVIDRLEPNRAKQKQLMKEAHEANPISPWLSIQLALKASEDAIAEEKRKKEEAKKTKDFPGQMKIDDALNSDQDEVEPEPEAELEDPQQENFEPEAE